LSSGNIVGMGWIQVVQPQGFPAVREIDLIRKKEWLQWYRPEPDAPLRLSKVTINFPMMIRRDGESESQGRETALNGWYGYCDLTQIATIHGQVVQHERTVKPTGEGVRENTSGDQIKDTGVQTHAFRITWNNLFDAVLDAFDMQVLQAYTRASEGSEVQNLKLAMCHPRYVTLGTPIDLSALRMAVQNSKQADGSVKDLYSASVLATLWVNPTRQSADQPHDGSSRAYGDDRWIANLVIRPEIQGHSPLILNRATLSVSHEVVDGVKEVFVREFDSRRSP
jgi:hypothetical protein